MAADFIPTVMARGFHAGPVFGIFGAADRRREDHGLHRRPGEQHDRALREPRRAATSKARAAAAARCARAAPCAMPCWRSRWRSRGTSAARPSSKATPASITPTPATTGPLTYSFVGDTRTSLDKITAGLGKNWMFLETLYRIYSTAGYNIAHIDVTAQLCEEHNIRYEDVERVEAVVNWLETQYPSPRFPEPARGSGRRGRAAPRTTRPTASSSAASRCCGAARRPGRRRRSARGARADEARDDHPVARDDALRSAHHDLHEGRQELHEAGHRAASSSGTSRRRRAAFATSSPACRSRRRSSNASSRPAARSKNTARADTLIKLTLK